MISGAGHDAMVMASVFPTAMLFVPSRGGRSHCLEEWTEYENLQKGIELVYHTVTSLEGTSDRYRKGSTSRETKVFVEETEEHSPSFLT